MNIGTHIIVDMYEINNLIFDKISKNNYYLFDIFIENIIKQNNATLLSKTIHHFNDNGAFTSLYLLAESHLSIHTWPENNFIAIDVFTCGKSNTENIVNELKNYLEPNYCEQYTKIRGAQRSIIIHNQNLK
jgi:S-adenosylmethionine decarboxylase